MKKSLLVLFTFLLVLTINLLWATVTATWTGTEDSNWHNPNNWDTGTVPDASTDVHVPNTAYYSPAVTSDATCNSITNQGTFTISNGATLNVQDFYDSNSDAALDVYGGSLNVNGGINVVGSLDVEGDGTNNASVSCNCLDCDGTVNEYDGNITCNEFGFYSGSVFNQSGGNFVATNGGDFGLLSSFNMSGNASFRYDGDSTNGNVTIDGNACFWAGNDDVSFYGAGYSIINVLSGYFSIAAFSSSGTLNVNGGSVYFHNTIIDGIVNIISGGLNIYGSFANNGTCNHTGGGLNVNGTFTNTGSYTSASGCTSTVDVFNNDETGICDINGGDQTINTLTNAGDFNADGTTEIEGVFTNSFTGETTVSGGTLLAGSADLDGTVDVFDGSFVISNFWYNSQKVVAI